MAGYVNPLQITRPAAPAAQPPAAMPGYGVTPRMKALGGYVDEQTKVAPKSILEALVRGGGAFFANRKLNKAEDERKGREADAREALVRAMMGEKIDPSVLVGIPGMEGQAFQIAQSQRDRAATLADQESNRAFQRETLGMNQDFQREIMGSQQDFQRQQAAQNAALQRELAAMRAQNAAGGVTLTPLQKKIDEEAAKELAPYMTGGFADVEKNVAQLDEAIATLESGKNVTGSMLNLGSGTGIDMIDAWYNPARVKTREQVEEVAQRNLRLVLGSQFTEKEGQRLIERAYNTNLDESVNAARVKALRDSIVAAAEAKKAALAHMQSAGTMVGFQGSMPTFADIEADFERRVKGQTDKPAAPSDGFGEMTVN